MFAPFSAWKDFLSFILRLKIIKNNIIKHEDPTNTPPVIFLNFSKSGDGSSMNAETGRLNITIPKINRNTKNSIANINDSSMEWRPISAALS